MRNCQGLSWHYSPLTMLLTTQGLSWHVIGDELGRYYRHCWDHYFMLHENKGRGPPAC